jgi:hypothetical protein
MAKHVDRLSDRTVKAAKVGMHCDGQGLYLQVGAGSEEGQFSRSWLFRYAATKTGADGKPRKGERVMGLGAYPGVSLADARAKAAEARKLRELGKARSMNATPSEPRQRLNGRQRQPGP